MRRILPLIALVLLFACQPKSLTKSQTASADSPLTLQILAINDFHGHLEPGNFKASATDQPVMAGGIEHLGSMVAKLKTEQAHSWVLGVGDLFGASPLQSALLKDAPAIEAMNLLGMQYSAVGNHEFDYGQAQFSELQKLARFRYLASNVDLSDGRAAFARYAVEQVEGVKIGIIGAVYRDTPTLASEKNMAGLQFFDEATRVNAAVAELSAQGVNAFVVLMHEGGEPAKSEATETQQDPPACNLEGVIADILQRMDRRVALVITAHSHKVYVCQSFGTLVTQGGEYGRVLTQITLALDRKTGKVIGSNAKNLIVDVSQWPANPEMTALLNRTKQTTNAITQKVVAHLPIAMISNTPDASGEAPMARVVADSQYQACRALGADAAMTNEWSVRLDLPNVPRPRDTAGFPVQLGDVHGTLPFGNELQLLDFSASDVLQLLETQFEGKERLVGSGNMSYQFDATKPVGQRVLPGSLQFNGKPLRADQRVKICLNSYLTGGGSGHKQLKGRPVLATAGLDRDALVSYLQSNIDPTSYLGMRSERVK